MARRTLERVHLVPLGMAGQRWWVGVAALALLTTACSTAERPGGQRPPTAVHTRPHATPSPSSPTPRPVSDEARLYAAALGGPDDRNVASKLRRVTYLVAQFCTGMIDIEKRGPCRPGPIPAGLQRYLQRLMGPGLRITDDPPVPRLTRRIGGTVIVQLGRADVHGTRALVAVDYHCGPVCGQGETLVLTRTSHAWAITGHSGQAWIS
jgi:hypothetical protein